MRRPILLAYRALGLLALGLAILGVALPGLPTTPFLLVAVWAFARGAPEWAARIHAHPSFGPYLRNWSERRVVPARAKLAAIVSMTASVAILWASGAALPLVGGVAAVCATVATYLLTRPST